MRFKKHIFLHRYRKNQTAISVTAETRNEGVGLFDVCSSNITNISNSSIEPDVTPEFGVTQALCTVDYC